MKFKLSILMIYVFTIMNLGIVGMENDNNEKKTAENQKMVVYQLDKNQYSFPIAVLQNKENVVIQLSQTNYEEESLISIVKIPFLTGGFKLFYNNDETDQEQQSDRKTKILDEITRLSIIRRDTQTSTSGEQSAKRVRILDLRPLKNLLVQANESKLFQQFLQKLEKNNQELEKLANNETIKNKVLQSNKQTQLKTEKNNSWETNKDYFRENKLNCFERNTFKFASIIGIFAFFASPYILNKFNLLHLFFAVKDVATDAAKKTVEQTTQN